MIVGVKFESGTWSPPRRRIAYNEPLCRHEITMRQRLPHLVLACLLAAGAANASAAVPALSVVAPNGERSILLGTMHVGLAGVRQPDAVIFNGARRFVIEHTSAPQPGDEGGDLAGKRRSWAAGLTKSDIETYLARARCLGIPSAKASSFLRRPSAQVANQIAYTSCAAEDRMARSRDHYLAHMRPSTVQPGELEEDAWVEAKRRTMPAALQASGLRWILARDPGKVLAGIRDALNDGDYDAIVDRWRASLGDADPHEVETYRRTMIDERNVAWLPRLRRYLDEGQAVILVGAMHLPGQRGLIALLQAEGYRVERVKLPESPTPAGTH